MPTFASRKPIWPEVCGSPDFARMTRSAHGKTREFLSHISLNTASWPAKKVVVLAGRWSE